MWADELGEVNRKKKMAEGSYGIGYGRGREIERSSYKQIVLKVKWFTVSRHLNLNFMGKESQE